MSKKMLSSLMSIVIVALSASIITAGYMEVVGKDREDENNSGS